MSSFLYSLLLRLLPRRRRERYGDEMAVVFELQLGDARRQRGWRGVAGLWLREAVRIVGIAISAAAAAERAHAGPRGGLRIQLGPELTWAWRGVRARGWRGGIVVGLLAVALAGVTMLFAVADSLVLHRIPYPERDRVVVIQSGTRARGATDASLTRNSFDQWRSQTDLFASVECYARSHLFVIDNGVSELVAAANVTPGVFEVLGIRPHWGRGFVPADAAERDFHPVLIAESLARRHFGHPADAPGQTLDAIGLPLRVVGVLSDSVRFPSGRERIWRALDPRGPVAKDMFAFDSIARVAPGLSLPALADAMAQRSAAIGVAAGRGDQYFAQPAPYALSTLAADRVTILLLLGASICLLITACANVIGLELAVAAQRSHRFAVQRALGATAGSLIRVALLEGAFLMGAACISAALLMAAGVGVLMSLLPAALVNSSVNVIDLDGRSIAMLIGLAAAACLVVTLPVAWSTTRRAQLSTMASHATGDTRRGRRFRHALMVLEVAMAAVLLVAGTLYVSSFVNLHRLDRGVDSANLVELEYTLPTFLHRTGESDRLHERVRARLREVPGVIAVLAGFAPPWSVDSAPARAQFEVDGRTGHGIAVGRHWIEPHALQSLGVPLLDGRWFDRQEPATSVLVPKALATRLFGAGSAVGHRLRLDPTDPERQIVGVVGDIRRLARTLPGPDDEQFLIYVPLEVRAARTSGPQLSVPSKPAEQEVYTGNGLMYTAYTVRLGPTASLTAVLDAARAADPRWQVEVMRVDDKYARLFGDIALSTRIVTAFGVVALIVALAGVYGLMAFLVAGRTREIGIRMALGADRWRIRRMILRSAGLLAAAGLVIGLAAAVGLTRFIEAQLFGVSAANPIVYGAVAAAVVVAAVIAAWRPASHAAGVDPAITLRAE